MKSPSSVSQLRDLAHHHSRIFFPSCRKPGSTHSFIIDSTFLAFSVIVALPFCASKLHVIYQTLVKDVRNLFINSQSNCFLWIILWIHVSYCHVYWFVLCLLLKSSKIQFSRGVGYLFKTTYIIDWFSIRTNWLNKLIKQSIHNFSEATS